MKFLIMFLVALSCSVTDDSVVVEEEIVETKPELSIQQKLEHMEGIHFKTETAFADANETVVQLVVMARANRLDIVKVWYTFNVFKNGGLLGQENTSSVVVTVQTLKKGNYTFDRQYIQVAQTGDEALDMVSQELKSVAERKFFTIIKLLVDNEVI